ncbi:MAG: DMT family transporter [Steroidobacteraceae bacterium]
MTDSGNSVAPRHLLLLVAITLVWGFNLIAAVEGVRQLPPLTFAFLRFAVVAVLLLPLLRFHRGAMGAMVSAALLAGGLHFGLLFVGLSTAVSVSSVAIASQLGVPFATLLSVALLGERIRWRRWCGIALAFAGVIVMGFDPRIFSNWQSLSLVVLSAFIGALGLIAIKKLQGFGALELQAWLSLISVPLLLALAWVFEGPPLEAAMRAPMSAWLSVLYTAIGASLFAHSSFYYLIRRYPVTSLAPMTTLSPVFSVMFATTLLHDPLSTRIIAGGILTVAGVAIVTLREGRIAEAAS